MHIRMISRSRDRRLAGAAAQRLHIMGSLREPVSSLSGGNQQKVVLGKWLATEPSVLLLDDPTKGVDVDAKEEFYGFLRQMLDQGTGILLNSSDDSELVRLCDRVLVMADGAIATELGGSALTEESLVATALGFESAANGGRR
jgi:ribose transport system ATP-binding protein